jgi:glycosyltransferase involved in cell wall biosynthesis
MRILTVSHFYEQHGGGIERVAAHLCRQFDSQAHVSLWAASDADSAPELPVRAVPLPCANPIERMTGLPMPIPGPRALVALDRAIREADAVIMHDALYLTSIAAMLIAKAHRKPVVMIQHIAGIAFSNPVMRAIMALANQLVTKPMLKAADRLIFISDAVRRDLIGDHPKTRFALLHNGVDSTLFRPTDPNESDAVRRRHGLPTGVPLAIFVGRFVEKKGLSVIRALARLWPELHIALVGSGPLRPEEWGLPNIHLLGPQQQTVIAQLFGAGDLLLLPSVGEGYPLVVQEAMAAGLPVVCGKDSAIADPMAAQWLRGVLIELADPDGSATRCAAAIDALVREPVNRASMAKYAASTYSWPAMAAAIVQLLCGHSTNSPNSPS